MARGGRTTTAGRPKSKRARKSPRKIGPAKAKAADEGLSPVDIIVGMMRGDLPFDEARFKAAVAAAPYVHARRRTADAAEGSSARHEDALKELE